MLKTGCKIIVCFHLCVNNTLCPPTPAGTGTRQMHPLIGKEKWREITKMLSINPFKFNNIIILTLSNLIINVTVHNCDKTGMISSDEE